MEKDLTIKNVQVQAITVPLRQPFITYLHQVNAIHALKLQLTLGNGLVGVGAATPNEQVTGDTMTTLKVIMEKVIGTQMIGQSLDAFEPLMAHLQKSIRGNFPAKAAFDIAIYDLCRQLYQVPLTNLLVVLSNQWRLIIRLVLVKLLRWWQKLSTLLLRASVTLRLSLVTGQSAQT